MIVERRKELLVRGRFRLDTTSNGKQISTRRRDVRFSPTCQSRSILLLRTDSTERLSLPTDFLTVPLNVYQCQMGPRPRC